MRHAWPPHQPRIGIAPGGGGPDRSCLQHHGVDWYLDLATVHGVTALGILLLTPWKSIIIRNGLAKRRFGNWTSVVLLGLVVIALGTGLLHSTGTI